MRRTPLSVQAYVDGIRAGNRAILSQAITLVESTRDDHRAIAVDILDAVLPYARDSVRIGISGIPGVGKSTFIESFGQHLVAAGNRLAVLAIDPTSTRTRGSILGDKTRMATLAQMEAAYIRPSPAGDSLGGVTRRTRESMRLCEAAGFNVVVVETVGVGQSETAVHTMTDCFLLLLLARSGDELQGMKRGIMELADVLLINKADGDNVTASKRAMAEFRSALHLFPPRPDGWSPPVNLASATEGTGIPEAWTTIEAFVAQSKASGAFQARRSAQYLDWFRDGLRETAIQRFLQVPGSRERLSALEQAVTAGRISAYRATEQFFSWLNDQRL